MKSAFSPSSTPRRIRTGDGTILTIGTINDGEFLQRSGTNLISAAAGSSSPSRIQTIKTGSQDLNTNAGVILTWNTNQFTTSDISHTSGSSNFTINTTGTYKISYSINGDSPSNSRKNPRISVLVNGVENLNTRSTAYSRNTNDDLLTATLPGFEISLNATDVITVRSIRSGSSGTLNSSPNECWIRIERVT